MIPDDPFIRELLPEFVDSWIDDIDNQYLQFVESKNESELYRLAHTLKGSCFQFGLDDVGNMGVELMALAHSHDWTKAAAMKEPIRNSFVKMKKFIEENPI